MSLVARTLALALLLAAAAAHAQIYRWTDEQGRVHYGQSPPPGAKASPVDSRVPPASGPAQPAPDLSQQEREFQQRRIEREQKAAAEQKTAAQAKQRCDRERERLAGMRSARRIVAGVDEKGERRYMSDGERNEAIASQEAAVARACN